MAKKDYSKLSKEELLEVIKNLESKKKYGLVWDEEKVPEKVVLDCQKQLPVLKEVKEKEIITDPNQPTNILIEGDNYHALSVLNYTHKGKIDLIYIDPPYNTGNKDFIYNDCYVEKEDSWRHSKWLNFMNKRLELAKELLTEKGVIFISIDDNEVAQLKLLCDRVFGEINFCGQWQWFKSATPPNLSNKIKKNLEFILVYEKQKNNSKFRGIKKVSKSNDPIVNKTNPLSILEFPAGSVKFSIENGKIKNKEYKAQSYIYEYLDEVEIVNFFNIKPFRVRSNFRWNQNGLMNQLKNNTKIFASKTNVISQKKAEYSEEVPPNLIDESVGVDTTEEAGKRLFEMFNQKVFDYPKPVSLIKYLLNFRHELKNETPIILDFFAGTGTTAQAVLELNNEDGGNRKFILCTNNELNGVGSDLANQNKEERIEEFGICQRATYPRLSKVINGYKNLKEEQIEGLGGNLKYFKTSFVKNRPNKDQLKIEITKQCTEMLCLKEGIFNLKTTAENYKIFEQNNSKENCFMAIFYDFANASLEELKKK